MSVSGVGAFGGREEGVGRKAGLGGEAASPGDTIRETVGTATVLIEILVGDAGAEVPAWGDLAALSSSALNGGSDD